MANLTLLTALIATLGSLALHQRQGIYGVLMALGGHFHALASRQLLGEAR